MSAHRIHCSFPLRTLLGKEGRRSRQKITLLTGPIQRVILKPQQKRDKMLNENGKELQDGRASPSSLRLVSWSVQSLWAARPEWREKSPNPPTASSFGVDSLMPVLATVTCTVTWTLQMFTSAGTLAHYRPLWFILLSDCFFITLTMVMLKQYLLGSWQLLGKVSLYIFAPHDSSVRQIQLSSPFCT